MRIRNLLLFLFSLCCALAHAEWQKPVLNVQTSEWQKGQVGYLYNKDAGAFFTSLGYTTGGSPYWGTRAGVCADSTANQIQFNEATGAVLPDLEEYLYDQDWSTWDGVTYLFQAYVPIKARWDEVWFGTTDSVTVWNDRQNSAASNLSFVWNIEPQSNGAIRIKASDRADGIIKATEAVHCVGYLGVLASRANDEIYFCGNIAEDTYVDWYFVTEADFQNSNLNEFSAQMDIYNTAMKLKAAIEQAEADCPGIDLAGPKAVYDNTGSTKEELLAAIDAVAAAVVAYNSSNASVDNPADLSGLITNSTFDTVGDFTGWSGTAFGAGGTTAACAEQYAKTFDSWQEITSAPKGVYMLKVDGYYRAGSAANSYQLFKTNDAAQNACCLYAVNGEDSVETAVMNIFKGIEPNTSIGSGDKSSVTDGDYTYYVPNTMASAVEYFEAGYYKDNKVMFGVTEDAFKIGVYKNTTISTDWSIFDNFTLTYYGNAAEAYQMWMDSYMAALPDYSSIEYVTASYIEAFNEAASQYATAGDYATVIANMKAVAAAAIPLAENVEAWNDLLEAIEKAKDVCNNEEIEGEYADLLADYIDFDVEDILAVKELTTEELIAEKEKIEKMTQDAVENCLKEGADFTSYLVNPDFENGSTGWTGVYAIGGNSNHCCESYGETSFDTYQEVKGAPVGLYEIRVQGFYRKNRDETAWLQYYDSEGNVLENPVESQAYVYLNDNKTKLKCVFEEPVDVDEVYTSGAWTDPNGEYWYPNDMSSASEAFAEGMYVSKAYGLVAQKGDVMRIGAKGTTNPDGSANTWAIWDDFKLTYRGYNAKLMKPLLQEAVENIDLSKPMGADVIDAAKAAKAAGEEALTQDDGKVMFAALSAIFAINDRIETSVALFESLAEKNEALVEAISISESSEGIKEQALTLYSEIADAIAAGTYTDAQAQEAIEKIAAMMIQLKIPAGYEDATDDNPVDFTCVVSTPGFDKDGTNSVEGWTIEGTASGYNFGNDDTQKSALALEFYEKGDYDMYQTFTGLPNGTYKVECKAFYRNGYTDGDFTSYQNGEKGLANMYAWAGGDSIDNSICLLASGAMVEDPGVGTTVTETDGTFVPNDMVSAVCFFDNDKYFNGIYVKVTDGTLRFGMKQTESISGGWLIMDNWTLTYYGAQSKHAVGPINYNGLTGDANGDGSVDVSDITAIAAYILGNEPDGFNAANADANGDGSIDVADITATAGIILANAKKEMEF